MCSLYWNRGVRSASGEGGGVLGGSNTPIWLRLKRNVSIAIMTALLLFFFIGGGGGGLSFERS